MKWLEGWKHCVRLDSCLLIVAVLLLQSGCTPRSHVWTPKGLSDGWKTGSAEDAGFDSSALTELTLSLENGKFPNTHAVLIEKDGRLIYEQYFDGTDEIWGRPLGHRKMTRDSLHDVRSISKSVTSALLGIALGDDYEKALTNSITSYFPDLKTDAKRQEVRLHHVLTMTAGYAWNEMRVPYTDKKNDEIQLNMSKDPVSFVLARTLRSPPGQAWYYNGGLSQVAAGVVCAITGRRFDTYANEALFRPLGISDYEWANVSHWDPPMPSAASGLRLRARDLAKIGSVYLHGGRWNGKQIVPEGWVEQSMKRHVQKLTHGWDRRGIYGYGYLWWHCKFPQGYTAIAGVGNGNQRLFILPEERIVVTILAGDYNRFEGHSERLLIRIMSARQTTPESE